MPIKVKQTLDIFNILYLLQMLTFNRGYILLCKLPSVQSFTQFVTPVSKHRAIQEVIGVDNITN